MGARAVGERLGRHAKWFSTFADQGRVAEISGPHDLFINNSGALQGEIDAFVSSVVELR